MTEMEKKSLTPLPGEESANEAVTIDDVSASMPAEAPSNAEDQEDSGDSGSQAPHQSSSSSKPLETEASERAPPAKPSCWSRFCKFLFDHHLPIGMVIGISLGLIWPPPGKELAGTPLATIGIVTIFLVSGLKLETSEIKSAFSNWKSLVLGLVLILVITPILAVPLKELPYSTAEFATGFAFFALMPSTISSGVVLTSQAGGNTATALFLSVGSNIISVGTVPLSLSLLLVDADSSDNVPTLLWKLAVTILLPLIVGKILRHIKPLKLGYYADKHKKALKVISNIMIIIIPWMKISESADSFEGIGASDIIGMIATAVCLHIVFFIINAVACRLFCVKGPERTAVLVLSSQKTISIGVAVLQYVPAAIGAKGLILLPNILGHFSQILIDSFLVSHWRLVSKAVDCKCKGAEPKAPPAEGLELSGRALESEAAVVDGSKDGGVSHRGPQTDLPVEAV